MDRGRRDLDPPERNIKFGFDFGFVAERYRKSRFRSAPYFLPPSRAGMAPVVARRSVVVRAHLFRLLT